MIKSRIERVVEENDIDLQSIDSLEKLDLMFRLEKEFDIALSPEDFKNFPTIDIDSVVSIVENKLGEQNE